MTGSQNAVDGTRTTADAYGGSSKIYHLRLHHYRRILVWSALAGTRLARCLHRARSVAGAIRKSRLKVLPTHLGSRSKVSVPGRPYFRRKWTTAQISQIAHESPDVPGLPPQDGGSSVGQPLRASTTCCCLPSASAGTVLASDIHPFGLLQEARVALVSDDDGLVPPACSLPAAGSSRSFGWSEAEEHLRLVVRHHGGGNQAGLWVPGHAVSALADSLAAPQCAQ